MAVNESRDMGDDFIEGATEGGLQKVAKNRGGDLDPYTRSFTGLSERYGVEYVPVSVERDMGGDPHSSMVKMRGGRQRTKFSPLGGTP